MAEFHQCASGVNVSAAELAERDHKTHRQLRTRELMLTHSQQASLVVVYVFYSYFCCTHIVKMFRTMPIPPIDCSSSLYMCWLEMLTRGINAPVLLIRGNQQSVLTAFS
jgi:hypothetical protein